MAKLLHALSPIPLEDKQGSSHGLPLQLLGFSGVVAGGWGGRLRRLPEELRPLPSLSSGLDSEEERVRERPLTLSFLAPPTVPSTCLGTSQLLQTLGLQAEG